MSAASTTTITTTTAEMAASRHAASGQKGMPRPRISS